MAIVCPLLGSAALSKRGTLCNNTLLSIFTHSNYKFVLYLYLISDFNQILPPNDLWILMRSLFIEIETVFSESSPDKPGGRVLWACCGSGTTPRQEEGNLLLPIKSTGSPKK